MLPQRGQGAGRRRRLLASRARPRSPRSGTARRRFRALPARPRPPPPPSGGGGPAPAAAIGAAAARTPLPRRLPRPGRLRLRLPPGPLIPPSRPALGSAGSRHTDQAQTPLPRGCTASGNAKRGARGNGLLLGGGSRSSEPSVSVCMCSLTGKPHRSLQSHMRLDGFYLSHPSITVQVEKNIYVPNQAREKHVEAKIVLKPLVYNTFLGKKI
ncbi:serine/arginine-rich splicing factor SR45-like [Pipra filicauda]|uniref:Serine/arginine-rich splicing factor SR45-like n=1 Tax=Pipra filicauda TaxID=649802 RepID=A0A7R5L8U1_9PASS|nr:serine/arginine-rich splicing factor SR45-like [Pipra filicauda]